MSVEEIKNAISQLEPSEVTKLADWFAEFQAHLWDQQIEAGITSGKLDVLANQAKVQHTNHMAKRL